MNLRLKFHDYPGDIPKRAKIALLEGRPEDAKLIYRAAKPSQGITEIAQTYGQRSCKSYKKQVRMKERAVLKRRARKVIENGLAEAGL